MPPFLCDQIIYIKKIKMYLIISYLHYTNYLNRMEQSSFKVYKNIILGEDILNRQLQIGHKYRHFKGNEYLVLNIAKHSETLEELVVYQALYNERGIWVRPLGMFLEQVEVNGKTVNRFEEINL